MYHLLKLHHNCGYCHFCVFSAAKLRNSWILMDLRCPAQGTLSQGDLYTCLVRWVSCHRFLRIVSVLAYASGFVPCASNFFPWVHLRLSAGRLAWSQVPWGWFYFPWGCAWFALGGLWSPGRVGAGPPWLFSCYVLDLVRGSLPVLSLSLWPKSLATPGICMQMVMLLYSIIMRSVFCDYI